MTELQIWQGLVNVIPLPTHERFGEMKGAYVNAVAEARSLNDFLQLISVEASQLAYYVLEVEDIRIRTDEEPNDLPEEIYELISQTKLTGKVAFGAFHIYMNDETQN